jgi:Fic family protein
MSTEPIRRIPWQPIEALVPGTIAANGAFAALDALRDEWERRLAQLRPDEQAAVRQRTLRKLSVETGILAQMDSLGMVLDFVRSARPLSSGFIRELHHAITRTQETYVVTDALGRVSDAPLPKGEWKTQPDHVLRQDNTLLEYAPPEQVASEVDRLVELWAALDPDRGVHPIVKAAWLHHRFVQIHPFADGNGRVARALTLLVLEKHRYAPLVVDRWHRTAYLKALDAATDGKLGDLVRLFVRLEGAALTSELERPAEDSGAGLAVEVAHTLAAQLAEARRRHESGIQRVLQVRAVAVGGRLREWFTRKREELLSVFRGQGLEDVRVVADIAAVTTFAELEPFPAGEDDGPTPREYIHTTPDAFRFVHSEPLGDIEQRAGELEVLLDEGLAVALAGLLRRA